MLLKFKKNRRVESYIIIIASLSSRISLEDRIRVLGSRRVIILSREDF